MCIASWYVRKIETLQADRLFKIKQNMQIRKPCDKSDIIMMSSPKQ